MYQRVMLWLLPCQDLESSGEIAPPTAAATELPGMSQLHSGVTTCRNACSKDAVHLHKMLDCGLASCTDVELMLTLLMASVESLG